MKIIAVIGLGYVGLTLAVELSKHFTVYGYDTSSKRINELNQHIDVNNIVTKAALGQANLKFTDQLEKIKPANFYIITIPTPAIFYELPNLNPLIDATRQLAQVLKKDDIVVYESTVYPGATEEICIPLIEELTKLKCGIDFHVGYSPERINFGDQIHTLKNTTKIISAYDNNALAQIANIYSAVCDNLHPVTTIKTAEAVKLIENIQRDVNIALMNEYVEIMHALNLDMHEILTAAQTKWNFIDFKPGFVGGHCIAVDPLYLAFKAKRLGVNHDLILTARKINDNFTQFIIKELNKLICTKLKIQDVLIGIFGVTYKENSPDIRDSLSLKLIKELQAAGFTCQVNDPLADKDLIKEKYQIDLLDLVEMRPITVAIITVAHDNYLKQGFEQITSSLTKPGIIMDIPNLFINEKASKEHIYWHL